MAMITLASPLSVRAARAAQVDEVIAYQLQDRVTFDTTWITDSTGKLFPLDLRDGESLTVEAVSEDDKLAFWHEYIRNMK